MNHALPIVTLFTASMYRAPGRYDLSPRNSRRRITSIINSAPYFGSYDCNAPGIDAFRGSSDCCAPGKPCVARSTPMGNPSKFSGSTTGTPPVLRKNRKEKMLQICHAKNARSLRIIQLHSLRSSGPCIPPELNPRITSPAAVHGNRTG